MITPTIQGSGDISMCMRNIPSTSFVIDSSAPICWGHSFGLQVLSHWTVYVPEAITMKFSLGLSNWFTPTRGSNPLVLANLIRQWQDLSFLTFGIPIRPFQAEFTSFTDASNKSWVPRCGIPRFRVRDPFRPQVHQHFGAQGGNFGPPSLFRFLRGHQLMIATDNTTFVASTTSWDPLQYPVMSSSGSVPMATNSRHSHPGQTHSRLSKCNRSSGPPISAEPAHNNRVKAIHLEIVTQIFRTWGTPG